MYGSTRILTRTLVAATLAGFIIGGFVPVTAGAGGNSRLLSSDLVLGNPDASMSRAEEVTPYTLRTPGWLPEGTEMVQVDWIIADAAGTGSVVNVDMWFSRPSGETLHVWQTNSIMLAGTSNDPASPVLGSPQLIDGEVWQEQYFTRGDTLMLQLGHRFGDGVTASLAGQVSLGVDTLRRVAASLD